MRKRERKGNEKISEYAMCELNKYLIKNDLNSVYKHNAMIIITIIKV